MALLKPLIPLGLMTHLTVALVAGLIAHSVPATASTVYCGRLLYSKEQYL